MAEWKERLAEASNIDVRTVSFGAAKKFFAVDVSGSTWGKIVKVEGQLVRNLSLNDADTVCRWDTECDESPQVVSKLVPESYWSARGGTNPEVILQQPAALEQIRSCDLWLLLTDGDIPDRFVNSLTSRASSLCLTDIPVVLVIVSDKAIVSPGATNISIAIPFFVGVNNAIILYKNARSGDLYVVAAKGCFNALYPNKDSLDDHSSSWDELPKFADESVFTTKCESLGISVVRSQDRRISKGVSLGPTYSSATGCTIDIDALLGQLQVDPPDLKNLLQDEAIYNLAIACKTRGCLDNLRSFLTRHKRQEVAVRLEDRHGAGDIIRQMENANLTSDQTDKLRWQLRAAHVSNRLSYTRSVQSPSEETRVATELNRLIDKALALITGIEKAGYTADILNRKSNRAMRADMVQASDANLHLLAMDLSNSVGAFRGACSICAGDEEIMSIVLKRLYTAEDNTTDFALNFPLAAGCNDRNIDLVSSQCICFQCALLCKKSIYQEELAAIVPTVEYTGVNKRYLDHQLCLAITTGLRTGASGIAQIFMTILDRVLETKPWCRIDEDQTNGDALDHEKSIRRQAFNWMLKAVLRNCNTRETFTEIGPWVPYPQALTWAFKDYEQAGLDGWIIQYPLNGFCQIIRWYGMLDDPLDESKVETVSKAKLMHLVVSTMMNDLLRQQDNGREWTHPFMRLLYRDFNAPGVPQDMCSSESIVTPPEFWNRLEDAMGNWPDVKRFLSIFSTGAQTAMCRRVQLAVFWAIFTQQTHTAPKTFFRTIAEREPLAAVILGKSDDLAADVPEAPVIEVLTSIFREHGPETDAIHGDDKSPPFVSPFGASVLRCGLEGCNVQFFTPKTAGEPATLPDPDTVRQRRAQHFKDVFGGQSSSTTGLPEPTRAPKAPTSSHCNLHRSIAQVWSRLDRPTKQKLYLGNDERALADFVSKVIFELCTKNGRGNIYQSGLDKATRDLLPSFFEALRRASGRLGLENPVDYVHDWTQNSLVAKIEYECFDGLPL